MPYTSMLIVRLVRHGTAAPSVVVPYSSIKTSAFIRNGDLAPGRQGDFLLIPVPFEFDLYRLVTLIRWVSSNLPNLVSQMMDGTGQQATWSSAHPLVDAEDRPPAFYDIMENHLRSPRDCQRLGSCQSTLLGGTLRYNAVLKLWLRGTGFLLLLESQCSLGVVRHLGA